MITNPNRPASAMTKREEFAKHAPSEVPSWFRFLYDRTHEHSVWDDEELFFAWRLYYADKMLEQLGEPNHH